MVEPSPSIPKHRSRQRPQTQKEGLITFWLEQKMAILPSGLWLLLAASAIGFSWYLRWDGNLQDSLYVGQWVAPLLLIGVYLKQVKLSHRLRANHDS